ncbi:MAG: ABC transporter permease, partial [Schwartzia sp.]|nr:ABC transporter permease [Schwartzia sp. (in: firmicutes)]
MGRRLYAYPYHLWTILFTVVPLALIVYFAFTSRSDASFTLDNLRQAAQPVYLGVLWHSVWLAGVSTFLCFLIG